MHGEQVHITAPSYKTFTAVAETSFGEIVLNIDFKGVMIIGCKIYQSI